MRVLAFALVLAATAAHADDAKTLYADGEKLYAHGQYLDAAAKFRAAYDADPDPVYLYNIAQAYRFGDDCAQSAAFYKQFLDKVPAAPNADKVKGWISEQEACAARDAAKQTLLPPAERRDAPPPPPPTPPGNARLYAGIGIAVAGLAVAGFGAYEFSLVGGIASDRDTAVAHGCPSNLAMPCTLDQWNALAKPFDDKARSKQVLGGALVGGGAALVATGLYLIISKVTADDEAEHVIVHPVPGGAAVQGTWTF